MNRFRRLLLNSLTALSLLLAIATAGLWVQGVIKYPTYCYYPNSSDGNESYFVGWHSGGVVVGWSRIEYLSPPQFSRGFMMSGYSDSDLYQQPRRLIPAGGGFRLERNTTTYATDPSIRVHWGAAGLPLWLPLLLFLVLPTKRGTTLLRDRSRHQFGHCPACGYDMRANPAQCSECGMEAVAITNARNPNDE